MRCSEFRYPEVIARCQHIKTNGVQCGSPSLRNRQFCFFHEKSRQRNLMINANRARRSRFALDLPLLEDPESIQVAIMQVSRLLLTNQIEHKTAALLLYALQTASSNLRNTCFQPKPQYVVIDPRGIPDTNLGDMAWYPEEFEEPPQGPRESKETYSATEEEKKSTDAQLPANFEACAELEDFEPWDQHENLVAKHRSAMKIPPGTVKITEWRKTSALDPM